MDKKTSELVYELAAEIFYKEATRKDAAASQYNLEHLANWSIETARVFVEVAKERGLIKTPAGLFDE